MASVNKDEALRCLGIAQSHHSTNNLTSALRFTKKSISLFSTPEARGFLTRLEKEESTGTSTSTAGGSTTGARQRNSSTTGSTSSSSSKPTQKVEEEVVPPREFTAAQLAVVKRIRGIKNHEYYKILELEKGCEDSAVKKAYKKVRLILPSPPLPHSSCLIVCRPCSKN